MAVGSRPSRPAIRSLLGIATALVLVVAGACGSDDGDASDRNEATTTGPLECQWPMFGRSPARTFAADPECPTTLSPATVPRLEQRWFHETGDVVTASPAVADDTVYVGDWAGTFYALDLIDGSERWTFEAKVHPTVYSGQIIASAAVADVGKERRVFFAGGKTMYALRSSDGELRWEHELNPGGGDDDPTEIQSSPVVADDLVIVGFDGHNQPGTRAGIIALDAASGDERWYFDPDDGGTPTGCAGVWSSPTVDLERRTVFVGSANCPTSPEGWNEYSEAIFALDLDTGEPKWSFQPRGPSNNDFDFAGSPNLFEADGQALVGLGGKDGIYYALDRATGELVWKVQASTPKPRRNYSTGGFIGAAAVADGTVVGGTAVDGGCPCLHGIDAATGTIAWTQDEAGPTFAASAIVNGVAFSGSTTDFTLRAVDLASGEVLWSQELSGGIAGGSAIVGDTVVTPAGIREPGVSPTGSGAGVFAFGPGTGDDGATSTTVQTLPPTTAAPPPTPVPADAPDTPACIGRPCDLGFDLKPPPAGTAPTATLWLTPDPFRVEVRAEGLGDPTAWLRPNSVAARKGAEAYAVFVSNDAMQGTMLCILDGDFDCVSDTLPADLLPGYNRVTIIAITNSTQLPTVAEGFDRLVTTISLDAPVTLR